MSHDDVLRRFVGKTMKDETAVDQPGIGTRRRRGLAGRILASPQRCAAQARASHSPCARHGEMPLPAVERPYRLRVRRRPREAGTAAEQDELDALLPGPDLQRLRDGALETQPRRVPGGRRGAGTAPAACIVIEDSVTGVTAGVAAGATVLGYSPGSPSHSPADALLASGAIAVFADMADLPALLGVDS